jgi:hypothetical protein
MATTSKGLRYPVGTDPVAIHTDLQNLATDVDGKLNVTVATTKGDLIVHNGTNEVRFGVGANGNLLRADSSTATGLAWEKHFSTESSVGGLIASYDASGSDTSVIFASIPQTYTDLEIIGRLSFTGATASTNTLVQVLINGSQVAEWTISLFSLQATANLKSEFSTGLEFATVTTQTGTLGNGIGGTIKISIPGYSLTSSKKTIYAELFSASSFSTANSDMSYSVAKTPTTDAVTSIEIRQASLFPIHANSFINVYGDFGG